MPFAIFTLPVFFLYGGPRHPMRDFFAAGVVAAFVGILVLFPSAIERFFVDVLGVPGQVVADRLGQVADALVGHARSPVGGAITMNPTPLTRWQTTMKVWLPINNCANAMGDGPASHCRTRVLPTVMRI